MPNWVWTVLLVTGHVVLFGFVSLHFIREMMDEKEITMSGCTCSEDVWISSRSFFGAYSTITLRIHEQGCEKGLPVKPEIVSSLRASSGSHYDQRSALRAFFGLKPSVGESWKFYEAAEAGSFKKILRRFPSSIREGVREQENAPEPGSDFFVGFRWG